MRTPGIDAPSVESKARGEPLLADLQLKVVTPMFGGGVTAGDIDEDNLIRASAIRGHMRFWWRACNAAAYESVEDLARAERLLWGSATREFEDKVEEATWGPGAIAVRVTGYSKGERFYHHETPRQGRSSLWDWRRDGNQGRDDAVLDYVLFPFTKQEGNATAPLDGVVDTCFRLRLALAPHAGKPGYPTKAKCQYAAEQALWAWITFGGIGARTRRGCGTLYCLGNGDEAEEPEIDAQAFQPAGSLKTWLENRYKRLVPRSHKPLSNVPSLAGCRMLVGSPAVHHVTAWGSAIRTLQQFLQGEGIGRNKRFRDPNGDRSKDSKRPGQSFWPEVGAVRRILGAGSGTDDYQKGYTVHSGAADYGHEFPRADLGLPRIVKVASYNNAPAATIEAGKQGQTRMASPLILKTLSISANHGHSIALLLQAPHVWDAGTPGIRIKERQSQALTPHPLDDAAHPPSWPRTKPKHVTDPGVKSARDAFRAFLVSKGWEEVIR